MMMMMMINSLSEKKIMIDAKMQTTNKLCFLVNDTVSSDNDVR